MSEVVAMNEFIWIGILVLAFITEMATAALVAVWFMPGALAGLILSALNVHIWIQVLVFAILSAVMLALAKTIFQKYVRKKPIVKTNTDALLGKNAVVIEDINNIQGQGAVKINAQTWSARAVDPSVIIKKGSIVEIRSPTVKSGSYFLIYMYF